MSLTFTKLFTSITESTIWSEDDQTRLVWITMLAMADRRGRVWGSIPGLANRARVSVEACERALEKFKQPDKYSRTPEHEGRRLADMDGGWTLLNHGKYRAIRDSEAIKESKRKYINRVRAEERGVDANVEKVDRSRANAEAESDTDILVKSKKKTRTTEEEIVSYYSSKPEFSFINIREEFSAFVKWHKEHKVPATDGRFGKWLRRIEPEIITVIKAYTHEQQSARNSYKSKHKEFPTREQLEIFMASPEWTQQN